MPVSGFQWKQKPPPGTLLDPAWVAATGCIGYWAFNEGAGVKVNDLSPTRATGTSQNPSQSQWLSGAGGLLLNGSNQYVDCGNASALSLTTGGGIAATVRLTAAASVAYWAVARDDASLGRSFALGTYNQTYGSGWWFQASGNSTIIAGPATVAGVWYRILVLGNSKVGWILYVNGQQVGTAAWLAPGASTGSLTIGERTYSGYQAPWPGIISQVSMWSRCPNTQQGCNDFAQVDYVNPWAGCLAPASRRFFTSSPASTIITRDTCISNSVGTGLLKDTKLYVCSWTGLLRDTQLLDSVGTGLSRDTQLFDSIGTGLLRDFRIYDSVATNLQRDSYLYTSIGTILLRDTELFNSVTTTIQRDIELFDSVATNLQRDMRLQSELLVGLIRDSSILMSLAVGVARDICIYDSTSGIVTRDFHSYISTSTNIVRDSSEYLESLKSLSKDNILYVEVKHCLSRDTRIYTSIIQPMIIAMARGVCQFSYPIRDGNLSYCYNTAIFAYPKRATSFS